MEETIKGKEVIAYKGMNANMSCRGFQFEVGKSYKIDKAKLCNCGFHACLSPLDVFGYYPQNEDSRYFKVKLSGEIAKCGSLDTKVAATEITILEEINIDEVIKTTEWWKNDNVLDLLYFSDGFARIKNCKRKYNFIGKDGKLLSKQWFERAGSFYDGFALVGRANHEYNYINKEGEIISDEWFKWLDFFRDEFAIVKRTNGEWAKIDKSGNLIKILQ